MIQIHALPECIAKDGDAWTYFKVKVARMDAVKCKAIPFWYVFAFCQW